MAARVLVATWQEDGFAGCARKVRAAAGMSLPRLVRGRRTARSVGAYFDLITDDGRLFYGDSFHLGYFPTAQKTPRRGARRAHRLVAGLARVEGAETVLDVGCGLAAPALRIAARHGCRVTGVNISREQVRQGTALVAERGLSDRVSLRRADARALDFPDASFDAVVCLEAAGDICVTEDDKARLVAELYRVLRPGGRVGFSDLAFRNDVSAAEDRELRAVLYHSAAELVTDWPALFGARGSGSASRGTSSANAPDLGARPGGVQPPRQRGGHRYGRRLADRTSATRADPRHPRRARDVPRVRRLQAVGNALLVRSFAQNDRARRHTWL